MKIRNAFRNWRGRVVAFFRKRKAKLKSRWRPRPTREPTPPELPKAQAWEDWEGEPGDNDACYGSGFKDFDELVTRVREVKEGLRMCHRGKVIYSGLHGGVKAALRLGRTFGIAICDDDTYIRSKQLDEYLVDMRMSFPINACNAYRGEDKETKMPYDHYVFISGAQTRPWGAVPMRPDDLALCFAVTHMVNYHPKKKSKRPHIFVHQEYVDVHPVDGEVTGYRVKGMNKQWQDPMKSDYGSYYSLVNFVATVEFSRTFINHWVLETKDELSGVPLIVPVSERNLVRILKGKKTDATRTGRSKPILHWVRAHQRVTGSNVRTHLRGTPEFRKKGMDWKLYMPGQHKRVGREMIGGYSYEFMNNKRQSAPGSGWSWLLSRLEAKDETANAMEHASRQSHPGSGGRETESIQREPVVPHAQLPAREDGMRLQS